MMKVPTNDAIITGIKDTHQFMKILVIIANVNDKLLMDEEACNYKTLCSLLALSKSGGITFNKEKVKTGKITSMHFVNISSVDILEIRKQLRKKANNLLNVEIDRCMEEKDDSAGSL